MEAVHIDMHALKNNYYHDPLPYHLWLMALDCKRRRDAFWRHHKKMKLRGNLLSVPLLVLTSITGLTSVAQLGGGSGGGSSLTIVSTVFGTSSALFAALQKYFQYPERAEHCKYMAKSYGRIAKRIENTMVFLKSEATRMSPETFQKFVEEVQKDTEALLQETDDIPGELINNNDFYKDVAMVNGVEKVEKATRIAARMVPDEDEEPPLEDEGSSP